MGGLCRFRWNAGGETPTEISSGLLPNMGFTSVMQIELHTPFAARLRRIFVINNAAQCNAALPLDVSDLNNEQPIRVILQTKVCFELNIAQCEKQTFFAKEVIKITSNSHKDCKISSANGV